MKFRVVIASMLYMLFFFVGCQTVKSAYDSYSVCKANAVCRAEMDKGADLASSLAVTVASSVPVPGVSGVAVVIGSASAMLASIVIGVWRGRKYKGQS